MKRMRQLIGSVLTVCALLSLTVCAHASDYYFWGAPPQEYYPSTSYEDVYGAGYHCGDQNLINYQIPNLTYGYFSTTQTGIIEKVRLPGLQSSLTTATLPGNYGISDSSSVVTAPVTGNSSTVIYQQTPYTGIENMKRSDGSIGTIAIPSLGITRKVYEGETSTSMTKGLGHFSSSSAWFGNVCLAGHNRGNAYAIGAIKDLDVGDVITYTTVYGTKTYSVSFVGIISSTDWSYLQATADSRITLITCLANQPDMRVCVQATEVLS